MDKGLIMDQNTLLMVLGGGFTTIFVPFMVWMVASIFYLKQEVAVMRQIFDMLKAKLDKL